MIFINKIKSVFYWFKWLLKPTDILRMMKDDKKFLLLVFLTIINAVLLIINLVRLGLQLALLP